MISHTTLGTNDLEKAGSFYNEILSIMGATKIYESEKVIFWEFEDGGAKLAISMTYNEEPATHGNGTMVALSLTSNDKVNEVYAKALILGGACEGEPGKRNDGAFYGAYFRDLDGNKIAVFHR